MSVTASLFVPLRADSARPLITYYNDATGERVELSVATLSNWAAKTANWLRDELDIQPGDPISVALPAHWQTAGALLGAWWCGAHVVDVASKAEVALVTADNPVDTAATVAVVSLDPMGRGLREVPTGAVDYISDMRVHGDDFHPYGPVDGAEPALQSLSVDDVVCAAKATELRPGDRVLSTVDWTLPTGIVEGLLAPLAAGASIVQCANLDAATRERKISTERVTAILDADGITRLDG
ncbi:TIGR03089 family protein [Pseudonocardiaceae bacterium YIM PH 21723]|nr:TIGR03089 family protein [Pseudonocardiaceae bacterium YIM PH 21723]